MKQPNSETVVSVTREQLPMHCPQPGSALWDSHPRVFIPLEESGEGTCSYCGTQFRLVDDAATSTTAQD